MKAKYPDAKADNTFAVIATYQTRLDREAVPHARDSRHLTILDLQTIARELADVMRAARAEAGNAPDDQLLTVLEREMREAKLLPRQLIARMTELKAAAPACVRSLKSR